MSSLPILRYPAYPSQPFNGQLPSMWSEVNRASDTRYSSSTAPFFEAKLMRSHGRQLAGTEMQVQDEAGGVEPAYAWNELKVYEAMDDVQHDGIFDPPGSRPNLYPDAGVLAARFGLPGYLARERMFAPSEVRDVTTGRPIITVPNSPVSFDTNAQVAFIEQGMFGPPQPVVRMNRSGRMAFQSTVNPANENPQPVKGLGATPPAWKWGVALGLAALTVWGAMKMVGGRQRAHAR